MEINIEARQLYLKKLSDYIDVSKSKISSALEILGWSITELKKKNKEIVTCPIKGEHYVPKENLDKHLKVCAWRDEGYRADDLALPMSYNSNKLGVTQVVIGKEDQARIIHEAAALNSDMKTGAAPDSDTRLIPQTSNRIMSDFTMDERRVLYDYVIAQTRADSLINSSDLNIPFQLVKKEEPKTLMECLAEERDIKRRRMSYRGVKVHTGHKSHSEIMREVIGNQMELYGEWLQYELGCKNEKTNEDCSRKHKGIEAGTWSHEGDTRRVSRRHEKTHGKDYIAAGHKDSDRGRQVTEAETTKLDNIRKNVNNMSEDVNVYKDRSRKLSCYEQSEHKRKHDRSKPYGNDREEGMRDSENRYQATRDKKNNNQDFKKCENTSEDINNETKFRYRETGRFEHGDDTTNQNSHRKSHRNSEDRYRYRDTERFEHGNDSTEHSSHRKSHRSSDDKCKYRDTERFEHHDNRADQSSHRKRRGASEDNTSTNSEMSYKSKKQDHTKMYYSESKKHKRKKSKKNKDGKYKHHGKRDRSKKLKYDMYFTNDEETESASLNKRNSDNKSEGFIITSGKCESSTSSPSQNNPVYGKHSDVSYADEMRTYIKKETASSDEFSC